MRRGLLAWVVAVNGLFLFWIARYLAKTTGPLGADDAWVRLTSPHNIWSIVQCLMLAAGILLEATRSRTAPVLNIGYYVIVFFWSVASTFGEAVGWLESGGMTLVFLVLLGVPCLGIAFITGTLYRRAGALGSGSPWSRLRHLLSVW